MENSNNNNSQIQQQEDSSFMKQNSILENTTSQNLFHSQSNSDIQQMLKIPDFEELEPPTMEKEDFIQFVGTQFQESNSWHIHFQVLNDIRSYNKFRPQEFCSSIIDIYLTDIMNACENLRSQVQRVGIKLIRELFLLSNTTDISDQSIQKITQKIFEKANYDKKFIRDEATKAVNELEKNKTSLCTTVIQTLNTLSFDKNHKVCELACSSLCNIIQTNQENLKLIQRQCLEDLIKNLAILMEGKRAKLKNFSKIICKLLKENVGDFVFDILEKSQKDLILRNITEKKDEKKRINFKDFKRAQTQLIKTNSSTIDTNQSQPFMTATKSNSSNLSSTVKPPLQNSKQQTSYLGEELNNNNNQGFHLEKAASLNIYDYPKSQEDEIMGSNLTEKQQLVNNQQLNFSKKTSQNNGVNFNKIHNNDYVQNEQQINNQLFVKKPVVVDINSQQNSASNGNICSSSGSSSYQQQQQQFQQQDMGNHSNSTNISNSSNNNRNQNNLISDMQFSNSQSQMEEEYVDEL